MARMVATKAALSIRLDALADADSKSSLDSATIGLENRAKLETRLRLLEQGMGHTSLRSISKAAGSTPGQKKFEMQGNGASYNSAADTLVPTAVVAEVKMDVEEEEDEEEKKKAEKKAKKEAKRLAKEAAAKAEGGDAVEEEDEVSFAFTAFHGSLPY
jgi:nucleolar protein 58